MSKQFKGRLNPNNFKVNDVIFSGPKDKNPIIVLHDKNSGSNYFQKVTESTNQWQKWLPWHDFDPTVPLEQSRMRLGSNTVMSQHAGGYAYNKPGIHIAYRNGKPIIYTMEGQIGFQPYNYNNRAKNDTGRYIVIHNTNKEATLALNNAKDFSQTKSITLPNGAKITPQQRELDLKFQGKAQLGREKAVAKEYQGKTSKEIINIYNKLYHEQKDKSLVENAPWALPGILVSPELDSNTTTFNKEKRKKFAALRNHIINHYLPHHEEMKSQLPAPGQPWPTGNEKQSSKFNFILPDGYPPLTEGWDQSSILGLSKEIPDSKASYFPEPGSMESVASWGFKGLENLDLTGNNSNIEGRTPNDTNGLKTGGSPTVLKTNEGVDPTEGVDTTKFKPKMAFPHGVEYRPGTDAYNKYQLRIMQSQ